MEISEQARRYLAVIGILIIIVLLIYHSSSNTFTCDKWANDFRDDAQFNLVLTKKENSHSRDAYFYGIDVASKKNTEYYDGGGWIAQNFSKFEIGDTLTKERGKYTIIIKRAGKILLIPFECDKVYSDK